MARRAKKILPAVELAKAEAVLRSRINVVQQAPPFDQWVQEHAWIEDPHKVGSVKTKFHPWPMQSEYFKLLDVSRQTITLKARQLGVSWCTIIYCVWLAAYHDNVTILVFSKDLDAAKEIIRRARFVFNHVTDKPTEEKGRAENQQEIKYNNGSRLKAFAATENAGTSFTATFLIVDEADKMKFGRDLYTSIKPTIDDGGRIAIIFTAYGGDGLGRLLWNTRSHAREDEAGEGLTRFFIPWHARPGRTKQWYDRVASEAISLAHHRQEYPSTAEEALMLTNLEDRFLRDPELWGKLYLPDNYPISLPGVMALDAGLESDTFAMSIATWLPDLRLPYLRHSRTWIPAESETGTLDLNAIYDEIRRYISTHRVQQVVYDPYQLASFGQDLNRILPSRPFGQSSERMVGDTNFRNLVLRAELRHDGGAMLATHVANADIRPDNEGTKMRIVKRAKDLKIDLAVAAAMATHELVTNYPPSRMNPVGMVATGLQNNFADTRNKNIFDGTPNFIYDRIR